MARLKCCKGNAHNKFDSHHEITSFNIHKHSFKETINFRLRLARKLKKLAAKTLRTGNKKQTWGRFKSHANLWLEMDVLRPIYSCQLFKWLLILFYRGNYLFMEKTEWRHKTEPLNSERGDSSSCVDAVDAVVVIAVVVVVVVDMPT